MTTERDQQLISIMRGLAMDAPKKANSGHQGTAMSLAPLAHVLFSRVLKHDPADPAWPDRDRFILSNGHASVLLYSLLYLNGYGLTIEDLQNFRQWGSLTPGHPEVHHTAGVEVTTGPLGQGFANAVGMAMAEQNLRARFGGDIVNHHTFAFVGDGCLMEGISHEAASLAGHLGLGRLVVVFDDNHITIDGHTELSCSDDVPARFRAYGWHVDEIGEVGNDCDALEAALLRAKGVVHQPSLVVLRTHIGYPSPRLTDNHEAHGNPFTDADIAETKRVLGIPEDQFFYAPAEIVGPYQTDIHAKGAKAHAAWQHRFDTWDGDKAAWHGAWNGPAAGWEKALPVSPAGEKLATRQSFQKVLNASLPHISGLLAGSADLTGNNGVKLTGATPLSATERGGTQIHFGIREHAMGAALNGMALHGGVLPLAGTFFVFSDYLRPALRLAALSQAHAVYIFSHDSVGVGEDGPTHQPIEQLMSLRLIPGLHVVRPADANEAAAAWLDAVEHKGPTALILTRQNVTTVTDGSAVATGAGVVIEATNAQVTLVATGSEVCLCVEAAAALAAAGVVARVVSMPSWDRFAAQKKAFQRSVLPTGVPTLSVEAGVTIGWERYAQDCIGIDRFGASAPGGVVMEHLGITVSNVVARAKALVSQIEKD
jgi:transketolase